MTHGRHVRVVLASASPARLATMRAAGVEPEVVAPDVDERAVDAPTPAGLAELLADRKCAEVATRLAGSNGPALVIGGDSVLELNGRAYGKPADADEAVRRWHSMRGREGVLHSGLSVRLTGGTEAQRRSAVSSAVVRFADLDDEEVEVYVATGEPLGVAGAFTIDGLGGAYVRGIDGDPHTVVGLSLPLLRELVGELGIRWHELWRSK